QQLIRVRPHQHPILEGSRLSFGRVAHQVATLTVRATGDARPLHPGRETGPTPTSQPGGAHHLDGGGWTGGQRCGETLPTAGRHPVVDRLDRRVPEQIASVAHSDDNSARSRYRSSDSGLASASVFFTGSPLTPARTA